MMLHGERAAELFMEGYNCAQAVLLAFSDVTGLENTQAAQMISSFGGMGGLREVCGAVSGMLMVAGILYGYESPTDDVAKKAHYARVQELAERFRQETGSIICREILKNIEISPVPSPPDSEVLRKAPLRKNGVPGSFCPG